ncbi:MAG: hypothetical protein ACOYWZ_14485 [Bacillota bacterium]
MAEVVHAFHKKTGSRCPICKEYMYMVHWHNKTRSFMCLKCHFGFNYKD